MVSPFSCLRERGVGGVRAGAAWEAASIPCGIVDVLDRLAALLLPPLSSRVL